MAPTGHDTKPSLDAAASRLLHCENYNSSPNAHAGFRHLLTHEGQHAHKHTQIHCKQHNCTCAGHSSTTLQNTEHSRGETQLLDARMPSIGKHTCLVHFPDVASFAYLVLWLQPS